MQSTKSALKFVNLACSGVSNADQISNLTVVMNASTLTGVSHVKVIVCIAPFMHIYIHHVQWICNVICIMHCLLWWKCVIYLPSGLSTRSVTISSLRAPLLASKQSNMVREFRNNCHITSFNDVVKMTLDRGTCPLHSPDNYVLPAAGHTIVIRGCAPFTSEVTFTSFLTSYRCVWLTKSDQILNFRLSPLKWLGVSEATIGRWSKHRLLSKTYF